MPSPLPKRTGKQIPLIIDSDERICFHMEMPDILEYRAAVMGQLIQLGYWFAWSHTQEDYSDIPTVNQDVAQLWAQIVADASFEVCMSFCEQMITCINTDEDVQTALAEMLATNPINQTTTYQTSVYGAPLNEAQRGAALATPPDCDLDVLFSMCTAIIDQLHKNNEDFLEILEVASNPTERARNVISAIPVIGLLPIDEAIEFIDQLVEEIQENYDAQYTSSIRDELRCALFCAAKDADDCIVTFDMLTAIFEDRLGYYLDPVNTAGAMVQYFLTSTWAGTTVVDIMTLVQVAFWRTASEWLGVNIRTLQIVARLVIDNPDPDWEILCLDCPVDDWIDNDFSTGTQWGWLPYVSGITFADWIEVGFEREDDATQIAIYKTISDVVTDIEVYFNAPLSGSGGVFWAGSTGLTGLQTGSTTDDQKFVWTGLAISGGLGLDLYRPSGFASNQYVERVRYKIAP